MLLSLRTPTGARRHGRPSPRGGHGRGHRCHARGEISVVNPTRRPLLAAVIGGLVLAVSGATLAQEPPFDLEAILARVGAQLERRYQRSQRIVSTEMVWVRSFTHDMRSNGSPQRLECERRVEWGTSEEDGVPTVRVFRELRSVNGREPQQRDLDACLTPLSETEDPLSVLLPVTNSEKVMKIKVGQLGSEH